MSERATMPNPETAPGVSIQLPDVTVGDDVQLRFAAAEWSQVYDRRMPSEGVSRVLGLQALTDGGFLVQYDTDNAFEPSRVLGTSAIKDVITAERNRTDQAPEGNTLAAILINGRPAQDGEKQTVRGDMSGSGLVGAATEYTKRDGAAIAEACREGNLRWRDVPKRMFVDIWYGHSVYYASEGPDSISRKEFQTYALHLRALGDGVFRLVRPMRMVSASRSDRFDVGREVQLEAWADTLKQGTWVRCFSGEGQSELALGRASLTFVESGAANPEESRLVQRQRALTQRVMDRLDIPMNKEAPRAFNIDFAGVPVNEYSARESLRARVKRELTESTRWGRASAPDGRHGGYAVTD